MSDNQNTGRGIYGKGYYIALVLCAAAIGITSYVYYRNDESVTPLVQEVASTLAPQEADVPVIATKPQNLTPEPTQAEQNVQGTSKVLQTTSPVVGQEVFGYAMEVLRYNETTRDWRTHNGVDIAAEAGSQVVAAADGEVYTTYEDETLGYTVVIRHEGGYTTHYSSLDENILVSAGDRVLMGQVIGTVGVSALVETVLGPHLHFSVSCQDVPMDPAEFLNLG